LKQKGVKMSNRISNRQKKEEIIYSLVSFLPQKIVLSKLTEDKHQTSESFLATLLFADISGFTAISEKLARLGKEGAEEVNKIINNFFGPLINIVYQYQGDIYRFGGDAFLAFFPQKSTIASSEERAIIAANEILDFVKTHTKTKTKAGSFWIKIHIGLTKGKVYFEDLGNNFFLGGSSVNNLMSIIDLARPGEIIVSSEVKEELPNVIFEPKGEVFKYIRMKKKTQLEVKEKEPPWEVDKREIFTSCGIYS